MLNEEVFFDNFKKLYNHRACCLAFSGGLDSRVLLHLLYQFSLRDSKFLIQVVHVHHGISPHADHWAKVCEKICDRYDICAKIIHITLSKKPQESLEDLARRKRYEVFRKLLKKDEILLTAHQQNDQAETLLLQLFRGAGPKGLAAMPVILPFGDGFLVRPLLGYSRAELENYALANRLDWVEDESNAQITFDRNFIRKKVLPLILTRWPTVNENLARSAKHCAQADNFISHKIATIFSGMFDQNKKSLFIPDLLLQDEATQSYILRYWLQQLNLPLPSSAKLTLLRDHILTCRQDAQPLIVWKKVEVRRFKHHLYAMPPLEPHDPTLIIPWNLEEDLILPNKLGKISIAQLEAQGLSKNLTVSKPVTIRFRQGGERYRFPNRSHTHALKKLFQAWHIPPWERSRVPLLYIAEDIQAVIGYVQGYVGWNRNL